jgi:hypothetical protein
MIDFCYFNYPIKSIKSIMFINFMKSLNYVYIIQLNY